MTVFSQKTRHRRCIVGAILLLALGFAQASQADRLTPLKPRQPRDATKVLHFPSDQCVGNLYLQPESGFGWEPKYVRLSGQWQYFIAAKGDVPVPEDRNLKLWVQLSLTPAESARFLKQNPWAHQLTVANRLRKDPHDLSGLSNLNPNDLLWLTVSTEMYGRTGVDPGVFEPISRLTGLRILNLSTTGITDEGLQHLRPLRSLIGLDLTQPSITSKGLAVLVDIPSLQYLSLHTGLTDAGLKHVARMSNLRWLRLSDAYLWGSGLTELAKLPRLERLCIAQTRVQLFDRHIRCLEGMTNLKSLTLWSNGCNTLTDSALASIAKLENLEELYFIRTSPRFTPAGLAHLQSLKKLRKITFAQIWASPTGVDRGDQVARHLAAMHQLESIEGVSYLSEEGVKAIATLRNLKHLSIALKDRRQGYDGPTGLSHLASLRRLEELGVQSGNTLSETDLAGLESMTALKDLRVSAPAVTDRGLAIIARIKQLERLDIDTMTRSGLNNLNSLTNLEYLKITARPDGYQPVADELTLDLSRLRNMKDLSISGVSLSDADLEFLKHMRSLEILMIQPISQLTTAPMQHLRHLPELHHLFISRISQCRTEDLASLQSLPKLRNLRLSGNVTARALASINGPASLETIRIETNNTIPRRIATTLKARHPILEYVHVHEPPPHQALPPPTKVTQPRRPSPPAQTPYRRTK